MTEMRETELGWEGGGHYGFHTSAGRCRCGHWRSDHEQEEPYPCRKCDCARGAGTYTVRVLLPAPPEYPDFSD